MDSNTLYAASMIGRQVSSEDQMIIDAWKEDGYESMIESKANDACEAAYEKYGADVYSKCRSAGIACGKDKSCDEVFLKYAKALARGYKGSFGDFKKRSASLASIGEIGMNLIGGWLSNVGKEKRGENVGSDDYFDDDDKPKKRTGLYIGLGVAAIAAIGVAIYFVRKNK
tara:strand:- start:2413 stop:2922 length:510 start_codon:yes stop_codon:yes gene_type:complete